MATKGVLVDAGPLVAILSAGGQHHARCKAAASTLRGPFFTTWPVITEAAYLLRNEPGAVEKLLGRIRDAKILLMPLSAADASGVIATLTLYADQGFDLAHATLMYLSEREGISRVFTIDQRHFSVYRSASGRALSLYPEATS